jgi:Spy/CpxP family protein refolding chaperone
MNKLIISLILGFCTSFAAVGETGSSPLAAPVPGVAPQADANKHHGIKLKQLSKELGLSEEQESKIKSLFKKHKQQIAEIRDDSKAELKNTLTPVQKFKLYQLKEKNSGKIDALKETIKEEEIKP